MLMRDSRVILPKRLQRKVTIVAHEMGHLGTSKTKEILRRKYWFLEMNRLVEEIVGKMF